MPKHYNEADTEITRTTTSTAAPSVLPNKVGDMHIDTFKGDIYIAVGVDNLADWSQINV